jgi:hypothetical protein
VRTDVNSKSSRIGKMTSEDLRVLDLDQNVATARKNNACLATGLDRPTGHEAASMTLQEWHKEAEQMLIAWHHDDPACVDKDHWQQCFERNYRPWEAARYARSAR